MAEFDLLIRGGRVFLPSSDPVPVNIAVRGGRIAALTEETPPASRVIEAGGLFVAPGFIDTHMHDEELEDGETVELALLRQGVTTAIAGNCGSGPLAAEIAPHRQHPLLNLGYLTGHTMLREAVGVKDIHAVPSAAQVGEMCGLLEHELGAEGSFGLSLGLEYLPETPVWELRELLAVAQKFRRVWVPVHIRSDGPEAVAAVDEIIGYAREYRLRFQISHTGSMCAFGDMAVILGHIDAARAEGLDLTYDCYPYDAFCTKAGSAVFEPGFEKRWGRGLEYLEAASGPYCGKRLSEDGLYERLRAEAPDTLVVAHVINGGEMELCLAHEGCAVASDSILEHGRGHPRAAGTFPRAINLLRRRGLSWSEAVRKCTELPAQMAFLDNKGRIMNGMDADFVIFAPDRLRDMATFAEQLLPPEGIEWVVIGGEPVLHNNELLKRGGRLVTRGDI